MTTIQRVALHAMAEENLGAVLCSFGWVFPCRIRESEAVALAVCKALMG